MNALMGIILAVFIATYIAISSEKVNRTATALLGMGVVGIILWFAGINFSTVIGTIEWHTILFVTAMMIIVTVAGATGMFQYIALEITKPTRGDTRKLFIVFLSFVFVISLFLDTVSTMLIMGPLTIEICKALYINFKPFLMCEAITCNFASIPSIVGAVPNLVIADKADVDPGLMFIVLMPLSAILFVLSLPIFLKYFSNQLAPGEEDMIDQLLLVESRHMIHSQNEFYASILSMLILVMGFTLGQGFGLEPSMIAITVAAILLLTSREWVDDILKRVNWSTIFFLIGLFGLVAALEITGFIDELGDTVGALLGDNVALGIVFMTWVPGLLSAVIDNIPVSAVLAPIASQFAPISPLLPLALIFAVNVGGFVLPIGSPANILALSLAEKEHKRISLAEFAKIGTPMGLLMLAIGNGWFLLVSFLFLL
jgi:Na+/H+ antiporter NhaD/arsenite permease-like protein